MSSPGSSMLPRAQQIRQGTSRVVPVVVSAGLAIGVFCGLLFGLGTGKSAAEPSKGTNGVKQTEAATVDPSAIDTSHVHDKDKAGSGSAAQASAGSADTGSAAGSAVPAATEAKITVEIKPDSAVSIAKVYVDGAEISGTSTTISLPAGTTKRKVTVAVKANGFNPAEDSQDVDGPTSFRFELNKSTPPATGTGTSTGNGNGNAGAGSKSNGGTTRPPPPPKKKPGGLIDI